MAAVVTWDKFRSFSKTRFLSSEMGTMSVQWPVQETVTEIPSRPVARSRIGHLHT